MTNATLVNEARAIEEEILNRIEEEYDDLMEMISDVEEEEKEDAIYMLDSVQDALYEFKILVSEVYETLSEDGQYELDEWVETVEVNYKYLSEYLHSSDSDEEED